MQVGVVVLGVVFVEYVQYGVVEVKVGVGGLIVLEVEFQVLCFEFGVGGLGLGKGVWGGIVCYGVRVMQLGGGRCLVCFGLFVGFICWVYLFVLFVWIFLFGFFCLGWFGVWFGFFFIFLCVGFMLGGGLFVVIFLFCFFGVLFFLVLL